MTYQIEALQAEYAPYHRMHAFRVAFETVMARRSWVRHSYRGVDEQAFDRGIEAACRVLQAMKG